MQSEESAHLGERLLNQAVQALGVKLQDMDEAHWIKLLKETGVNVPGTRRRATVITGSHDMVTDRRDWSERTASWLAEAASMGASILGICYGHQLLAHALGGTVDYNLLGPERGTTEVTLLKAASTDPLFGGLPQTIEVHVSHSQSVLRLPSDAVALAANNWDSNQAFRVGDRAWGVQFHPEFDAGIMHAYAAAEKLPAGIRIIDTPFGGRILKRFALLALGLPQSASEGR